MLLFNCADYVSNDPESYGRIWDPLRDGERLVESVCVFCAVKDDKKEEKIRGRGRHESPTQQSTYLHALKYATPQCEIKDIT